MKQRRLLAALAAATLALSGAGVAQAETTYAGVDQDPNYRWTSDPLDLLLAQSASQVLHRTSQSWFDAPAAPQEAVEAEAADQALIGPGTPVYVGNSICTIAVAGFDAAGNPVALTAGHCGREGAPVVSSDAPLVGEIGYVARVNHDLDYALIALTPQAVPVNSYNGVTVASLGGDTTIAEQVCKQGVGTGYSCGPVLVPQPTETVAQICATHGDSGAPVVVGDRLVGIISGGLLAEGMSCVTPWQGFLFQPTVISNLDAILADLNNGFGAGFHLA